MRSIQETDNTLFFRFRCACMARVSNRIKLEQEHGSDEEPVTSSKSNITGPQYTFPRISGMRMVSMSTYRLTLNLGHPLTVTAYGGPAETGKLRSDHWHGVFEESIWLRKTAFRTIDSLSPSSFKFHNAIAHNAADRASLVREELTLLGNTCDTGTPYE